MNEATFALLLSPQGQQALAEAEAGQPREEDFLRTVEKLRRRYPPELAQAALETAILRQAAATKYPQAAQMYFSRLALEQASNWATATYRAERMAGFGRFLDLGCSTGGDTLALAEYGPATGIDRDGLRLRMAQANAQALGMAQRARFVQADLEQALPLHLDEQTAWFCDPGRRSGGRRVFSVREYQPPLAVIREWLPKSPAGAVKLSPGVRLEELQPYQAEVEFLSQRGELKEAVLWFGPLRGAIRRATLLPGRRSLSRAAEDPAPERLPLSEPQAILYEPDPAVLRAGLVQELGWQLGAAQLDREIAYLTSAQVVATPFARQWQIEAWLPFNLKRLRQELRRLGVNRVVVKKRGSPLQPEEVIRLLRLEKQVAGAGEERVVFLTHLRGRPIAVICLP